MSQDEMTAFLQERGHGVLAFGDEDGGYATPMSFGFDADNRQCIFQFVFGSNSTKRTYVEREATATLVVHERPAIDDWRSVVAEGDVEPLSNTSVQRAAAVFADHANVTSFDVFDDPLEEADVEWFEFQIREMNGRQATDPGTGG